MAAEKIQPEGGKPVDQADFVHMVRMSEHASAFSQALALYQGTYPQRDDITVLSFRFDQKQAQHDPH